MNDSRTPRLQVSSDNRDDRNDAVTGYEALKNGVAVVEHPQIVLRLTGGDSIGMLNAILTNDVPQDEKRGVYAALLNPKGRIQTDLRVLKSGGYLLVITEPEGEEAAKEILGRYAPFSRVKIEETLLGVLGLYGPRAKDFLEIKLAEYETTEIELEGLSLLVTGVEVPVPGYDLICPADGLGSTREYLIENGAVPAARDAYETARIEAGVPRFGPDITPDNFPAESGILERAVSFEKGCYPGQETVARMHYRGHPNRELHRFVVEGQLPPSRTPILQNGKNVGEMTSVAPLPVNGKTLALGYLHRNADLESPLKTGDAAVIPSPN